MLNRITLIGRLVADPELKNTNSGIAVINCNLAVERNYKDASGEKPTDFINIVAWKKTAELIAQYCSKGNMLGIDGSLQMRKYETREGVERTTYEVNAEQVQFLTPKGEGGSRPPAGQGQPAPNPIPKDEDSELPF